MIASYSNLSLFGRQWWTTIIIICDSDAEEGEGEKGEGDRPW